MSIPRFSADAAVYRSPIPYLTVSTGGTAGIAPQQLAARLSDSQLYWCRLACLYCHYTGYYCWTCYICAWIIVLGGATSQREV